MSKAISVTFNREQNLAEEKAEAVIKSCITTQHFDNARVYLDLFHKQYQDAVAYTRLWSLWKKSIISL